MNFFNKNNEDENKKRLQNLVNQTKKNEEPSYDGETFVIATSSEINIYRNEKNGS